MTRLLDATDKDVCYVAKFNNSQDIEDVKEIVGDKQVIPQLITHAIGGFCIGVIRRFYIILVDITLIHDPFLNKPILY